MKVNPALPRVTANSIIIRQALGDDSFVGESATFEEMKQQGCRPPREREEDICPQHQPPTKKCKVDKKVRIVEEENELYFRAYDQEEIQEAWMSESDFDAIKQANRETLFKIIQSLGEISKVDAHEFCLRGLERHVEMFYMRRKRNNKEIIQRVLADQMLLRSLGITDSRMIGQVYGELSRHATRRALDLAFVDALN